MARNAWLGWSKALWKRFGAVALPVVGIPLALKWLIGLSLTTGFTGMTALLLLAYTLETQEMRRQMVLQNEIAIKPVVIATLEWDHSGIPRLTLRNIGQGSALFLKVRDLPLKDPAGDGVQFVATFAPVNYLEPGNETTLRIAECRAIDAAVPGSQFDPVQSLEQSTALDDYDVIIDYQDTGGGLRQTVMRIGKGGVSLVPPAKV